MNTYDVHVQAETIIDEIGSLQLFYQMIEKLSNTKHVKFTNRLDEADTLAWSFRFRGHEFSLEYNIFNGLFLINKSTNQKAATELAYQLKTN